MADPTDIELKIKTEADTAGAEETKKSIFAVEDAAKSASRQADADIVKGKQAAAVQREQAASLAQVVEMQQRIVAGQLAKAISEVSQQFKGLSPEVDLAITAGQNFLTTFASTGNPITATLALTATAIGGVVTAYSDAAKKVKEIATTEKETLKEIADLRAAYAAQIRAENLTAFFQKELTALEQQEGALKRIYQIRASERELAAAQQAASGQAAVAAGASPEGVAAINLVASQAAKIATLNDALTAGQAAVDAAAVKASDLQLQANALVKLQGEGGDEAVAATKAATAAAADAQETAAAFVDFSKITNLQLQTLSTEGVAAAATVSEAGLAAITAAAQKEKDALTVEVERLGKYASTNAKAALENLTKVLADGVIKPEELALISSAMANIRGSREASDKLVKDGFDALAKADTAFINTITPVVSQLGETLTAVQQIQGDQASQQFQIVEIQRALENMARMLTSSQSAR